MILNSTGNGQMKNLRKNVILTSLMLLIFALIIIGCGKKGPPIVPRMKMPEPVTDLQSSMEGDTLTLTWKVPKMQSAINGYIVYRSKTALTETECEDCPVLFERIIDIPLMEEDPDKQGGTVMTHSELLDKGYKYIYKVNPYIEGGIVGRDSNFVTVTFE